jgi:acylphosphatase
MANKRTHVFIEGRVQGVFFRAETQKTANNYNVKGWVKNLYDGRVEALFEGKEEDVERAVLWCHQGPAHSSVTGVEAKEEFFTGEFDSFSITY